MCNSALSCFKDRALYKYCILLLLLLVMSDHFFKNCEANGLESLENISKCPRHYMHSDACILPVFKVLRLVC